MKQYVGLDVSLKEISICVVDVDGAAPVRGTAPTESGGVANFLAEQQITPRLNVHESGQFSIWLQRGLEKLGLPTTCIDARRAHKALSAKLNKSDRALSRRCFASRARQWMRRGWPIWHAWVSSPLYTSGAKLRTGCAP